jgi:hypothetical protein
MKERSLDVFRPGVIVHPILGEFLNPSFPSPLPKYISSFPLSLPISTFHFLHIQRGKTGSSLSAHRRAFTSKASRCAMFFLFQANPFPKVKHTPVAEATTLVSRLITYSVMT